MQLALAGLDAHLARKLEPLLRRRDLFKIYGNPEAPLGLVSWGSCAGVCREALVLAHAMGLKAKLLVPYLVYPVAEEVYREFLASVRAGLVERHDVEVLTSHLLDDLIEEIRRDLQQSIRRKFGRFFRRDVMQHEDGAEAAQGRLERTRNPAVVQG